LDPTSQSAQTLSLRAATTDDRSFLLAVFASTRTDELAELAWSPTQSEAFIQMQFSVQQQIYSASYPAATDCIILLGERPVGRMLVDKGPEEFVLVDIALLAEQRNAGIGSTLIQKLLSEAAAQARPVRLHVINFSPALRLYERLGFFSISDDGVYLEMQWTG
jgi:ribosomal protein S18 acetylase RimI-like enzyme